MTFSQGGEPLSRPDHKEIPAIAVVKSNNDAQNEYEIFKDKNCPTSIDCQLPTEKGYLKLNNLFYIKFSITYIKHTIFIKQNDISVIVHGIFIEKNIQNIQEN